VRTALPIRCWEEDWIVGGRFWPCVCQGDDPIGHKHYDEGKHTCARCLKCPGYRPRIPEHVAIRALIGPVMSNEQATTILIGPPAAKEQE
jgi:hypothetical protein